VSAAQVNGKVDKGAEVMHAADHGIVGDGITDDGAALNALLSSAATFGLRVQLTAGSVVRSTVTITPPSGTRLDLNGATLKNAMASSSGRVLTVSGRSNVLIHNGIIDGDKAGFAGATEQRHNIYIVNSSHITLRDVVSKNAKGDGIYIGDDVSGLCTDVVLDRVTCDGNHRQGLSVSAVDGLFGFACRFINTAGIAPQAGMDVEPNTDTAIVRRIKMVACDFRGNATQGLLVSTRATPAVVQDGGEYVGCSFDGNTNGILLDNGSSVVVSGGTVKGNTGAGVWLSSATAGFCNDNTFTGVKIVGNGGKGVLLDQKFNRLAFVGCTILNNTGIGVDALPAAASVGFVFTGNVSGNGTGSTTQTHGLRTGANVSRATMVGNVYPANATASTSRSDDVTTRFQSDEARVATSVAADWSGKHTWAASSGSTLIGLRTTGNTVDQVALRTDGVLTFSSGVAAQDTQLSRVAAGVLAVGLDDCLRTGRNVTGSRPAADAAGQGAQFYDTTLSKPVWSDGTNWRDAAGTVV